MAGMGALGDAGAGDACVVLLLQLRDVALVQVVLARCLRAGGDELEGDGGGKHVDSVMTIHWHYPWAVIGYWNEDAACAAFVLTHYDFNSHRCQTGNADPIARMEAQREPERNPKRDRRCWPPLRGVKPTRI